MIGATHTNCVETGCYKIGNDTFLSQQHGERSRPEFFGKTFGLRRDACHILLKFPEVVDMNDQWIERRTVLDFEYLRYGVGIQSITGKSIDCFSWDRYEFASLQ